MSSQEAVEFATKLLRRMLMRHVDGRSFAAQFRKMDVYDLPKLQYLFDPNNHAEFVRKHNLALAGDKDARADMLEWGSLAFAVAKDLPPRLKQYISEELFHLAEEARIRRGPNRDDLTPRNFAFLYTIARVSERFGLYPTRQQKHMDCGCSITAKAAENLRREMTPEMRGKFRLPASEAVLEDEWGKRSAMPTELREYIDGPQRLPFEDEAASSE
jgi:hypothetical protein